MYLHNRDLSKQKILCQLSIVDIFGANDIAPLAGGPQTVGMTGFLEVL